MESTVLTLKTASLRPHPLNNTIYDSMTEESEQFQDLLRSIETLGILQPLIVRPSGVILSGHRRWQVACHLKLEEVPCQYAPEGDDRLLIVEYNRYRRKTISELMREAELIELVVKEKALAQIQAGVAVVVPIRTDKEVGEAIGMKRENYRLVKKVHEAAKTNKNAKAIMDKLDRGEISVSGAFNAVRPLIKADLPEGAEVFRSEEPEYIKHYNFMHFNTCDPNFGIPHPGRKPGQLVGNLVWMYSEEGDLCVDPMAGGGTLIDVCASLKREVKAYDLTPKRPDIEKWDISKGFPIEAEGAQLIYMDPPYWNVVDYGEGGSALPLESFNVWYSQVLQDAAKTVRLGGFVAVTIMPQIFRLPEDFQDGYIDWSFITYYELLEAGLCPWNRIGSTEPITSFTGFDMERAKEGKYTLPILYDTIIMRRMS